MNNDPDSSKIQQAEVDEVLAEIQKKNPAAYARFQSLTPEQMESAKEHLLAVAAWRRTAGQGDGHGHSHTHSSSCRHSDESVARSTQPLPPPVENIDPSQMNIVQAVQFNELDRVKQLIESGQADVNAPDAEKCYLLHWAAINNHVDLVRYLISRGAVVDIKGGDLQSTPLHWSCRQGCVETFFILVDHGAAIDSTDINMIQPIHLAAQYQQIKILAHILGSGIHVDITDSHGFTPLIYSCIGPPQGYVPLANATHITCTQLLLTFGADINYQEPTRRYTPLHFAVGSHNTAAFLALTAHPQINLQLKDNSNCDAALLATMRNNSAAANMIDRINNSSKQHIRPQFIRRYVGKESVRKWFTRFYLLMTLTGIGWILNLYGYSLWVRAISIILLFLIATNIFHYLFFDQYCIENLTFSYLISATILMYITYIQYLELYRWEFANLLYHFCTLYGFYCVYKVRNMNPGFIKNQTMTIDGNMLTKEKMCMIFARDPRWTIDHFCVSCLIRRPLRSKHCPVDRTCVSKFDHHCTWLGACIGERNHFYFMRVLTCGTVALFLWLRRAYKMISLDNDDFTLKFLFTQYYDPWFIYLFALTCFNVLWVTPMSLFHWINSVFYGLTLNERLTGYRYPYFRDETTGKFHNPFARQYFKNFLETSGLFGIMAFFGYTRTDWSQIYEINQIDGIKIC